VSAATVTSKGQITLPKDVRDDLGLKPGDKVEFEKRNGRYVLRPRNVSAADLVGFLGVPPAGRGMTIEEMDEALGQALAEDDERIRAGR
jgi:AbrB family looped-hinge helix DNA binding protein